MVEEVGQRVVALAKSRGPLLLEQGTEEGLMRLDLVFRKEEEVEELIATLVTLEVGLLLQH